MATSYGHGVILGQKTDKKVSFLRFKKSKNIDDIARNMKKIEFGDGIF